MDIANFNGNLPMNHLLQELHSLSQFDIEAKGAIIVICTIKSSQFFAPALRIIKASCRPAVKIVLFALF